MSDWEHVDKEEIIISEDGLDEAIHNAYLKGKQDMLDKIRAEIEDLDRFYDSDYFSGNKDSMFKCNEVLQIIDKYRESEEEYYQGEFMKPTTVVHEASMYGRLCGVTDSRYIVQDAPTIIEADAESEKV